MIPIQLLGISLISSFLVSQQPTRTYHFTNVKTINQANYNKDYALFCAKDSASNFEVNAVLSSFFGDYEQTLIYATRDANPLSSPFGKLKQEEITTKRKSLEQALADPNTAAEKKATAQKILTLIESWYDPGKELNAKVPVPAKEYIINQADKYHFVLINEAHYSSQNRAFTNSLLKPLWDKGFRYLALEALSYTDENLSHRGYPVQSTGYYIKDPVFGNMLRNALAIGYKLIPYETRSDHDGTKRDFDQASNIYNSTLKNDTVGKVLIHAGYSHIVENGDSKYDPMGSQLKKIVNQDVLTIDQESMLGLLDTAKVNRYYKHAIQNFNFENPVVFVDNNNRAFVDPLNNSGIDIQVFHPLTRFINGRPSWILNEKNKCYELPKSYRKYQSHLIQAVKRNEGAQAVPVDQFIIKNKAALILPAGEYDLKIIDCKGTLVGVGSLKTE